MFLHVFAHVQAYHIVFRIEQGFRKCLAKLCLAYACRAEEDESTGWASRIGKPCPGTQNGVGHCIDSIILPDNAIMQLFAQAQKLFAFGFQQTGNRNACPFGNDFSHVIRADFLAQQARTAVFLARNFLKFLFQFKQGGIFELSGLVQIVCAFGLLDFAAGLLNVFLDLADIVNRAFFAFPLGAHGGLLVPQFGKLVFQFFQSFK